LADYFGYDFRVGVGGLLGRTVPGDVGLDDDHILAADEAADAAQVFESSLNERARFPTLNYCDFRVLGVGGDAMVAAGLLGMGGDRTEAVLTEPDSSGGCGGRGTTYAENLEHGLATGEGGRSLFQVRLRFGLLCHRGLPVEDACWGGGFPPLRRKNARMGHPALL
jgi:hypothetical protein